MERASKIALVTIALMAICNLTTAHAQAPSEAWVATYNGPGNDTDYAESIAVDSQGNIYVTGRSIGLAGPSGAWDDYATIKYDANGNMLWVKRYGGLDCSIDRPIGIAVDNAGNVYVTGGSASFATHYDIATVKYDSNGNELWVAKYNGPGNEYDYGYWVAVDDAGNVYVLGPSCGIGTAGDYATIKYDASGNELWVARYNGPASDWDDPQRMALDSAGNVYVTGLSAAVDIDYATIKYDASGNELWVRRYQGPGLGADIAHNIAIDSAGDVYVAGYSAGSGSDYDIATVKYDTNGNMLWVGRYNGPGNGPDGAYDMTADNAGNVYVTGWSYGGATGYDIATIKYDADGKELWAGRYNGGYGHDVSYGIAIDNAGGVYVTGYNETPASGLDIATIKYDASGNEVWAAKYNGPDNVNDIAYDIVLDNASNVYVTGGTRWGGAGSDYVTIKYAQVVENQPPMLEPVADQVAYVNAPFELQLAGSDPDNDPLTFSASGLPIGLLCSADGLISGAPTTTGHYPVTASLTDGVNDPVTQSFLITVCNIKVTPRTVNLKSKGTFTVFIDVPGNIPLSEIEAASIKANGISPASVKLEPHRIIAKFDRQGFDFGDGTVRVVAKRVHNGIVQWMLGQDTVTLIQ